MYRPTIMKLFFISLILFTMLLLVSTSSPAVISYQGRLTDSLGNMVPNAAYNVIFSLHDSATGGSQLWQEAASITTTGGLFTHQLGSTTEFPGDLFRDNENLFLQTSVGGVALVPRQQLSSVPFAMIAAESQREPGIAAGISTALIPLTTGSMTDLVGLDITIPEAGYIVLQGKCYLMLSGTTGANQALVQIDETEGGGSSYPYYTVAGLGGYVNTAINYFPIYVTRIYFKQKGTYEFRMEGRASFGPPAVVKAWDHILTAVYYPTGYNKVLSLTADPSGFSGALPIISSDSLIRERSGTYYQVDLRELERQHRRKSANDDN